MLRKILAVDDSALIHQMYKLFLSRYKNCKLISAMNGLEALEKSPKRRASTSSCWTSTCR